MIVRRKLKLGFWFAICVANGVGFEATSQIDVNEMGELKNFADQMDKGIQKWIEANPDKADENAQVLMDLVDEYKKLSVE